MNIFQKHEMVILCYGINIFQRSIRCFRNFGTLKPRSQQKTKKKGNTKNEKPRNQETYPPTHQHTDSHPCTSPPLGGHERTWGTRRKTRGLASTSVWGNILIENLLIHYFQDLCTYNFTDISLNEFK